MFLLFLVFLVLKLIHVITWSWWWVTAPLWGPLALFFSVFLFFLLGFGIFWLFGDRENTYFTWTWKRKS